MSKASEWANLNKQRPVFQYGTLVKARVNEDGKLELGGPYQGSNEMSVNEALLFANWIIDTFKD